MNLSIFQKEIIDSILLLSNYSNVDDDIYTTLDEILKKLDCQLSYSPSKKNELLFYSPSNASPSEKNSIDTFISGYNLHEPLIHATDILKNQEQFQKVWEEMLSENEILCNDLTNARILRASFFSKLKDAHNLLSILLEKKILNSNLESPRKIEWGITRSDRHIPNLPHTISPDTFLEFINFISTTYILINKKKLKDFKESGYLSDEEIGRLEVIKQAERSAQSAKKSARWTFFAAVASLLAVCISLASTVVSCQNKRTPTPFYLTQPVQVQQENIRNFPSSINFNDANLSRQLDIHLIQKL